jgi:16S rRNA (uracil1498-N3)-methyltransferase
MQTSRPAAQADLIDKRQSAIDNLPMRLYCPHLRAGDIELPVEEAHHAVVSLRAEVGTPVTLFDGQGHEAQASITSSSKRHLTAQVGEIRTRPFDCAYRLTIVIALGKAHRQSYVVEKCTELGVDQIWPIITQRSVTKPGEAAVAKWSRRAIEAAKQSGRAYVPAIARTQAFSDVLKNIGEFAAMAIADLPSKLAGGPLDDQADAADQSTIDIRQSTISPGSVEPVSFLHWLRSFPPGARVACLIGPEGGWSDVEREAARTAGLMPVLLAPNVLRTETAAATACAAAALLSTNGHRVR